MSMDMIFYGAEIVILSVVTLLLQFRIRRRK